MSFPPEATIKQLITRYQQNIFSLVLYLIGGDRNAAYDITVSAFAQTLPLMSLGMEDGKFFMRLLSVAVAKSRQARVIPLSDETDLIDLPPEKRTALRFARTALQTLPFESRVFLLLRDQLHLPYQQIAGILKMPEKKARIQTAQSRGQMRMRLESVLRGER